MTNSFTAIDPKKVVFVVLIALFVSISACAKSPIDVVTPTPTSSKTPLPTQTQTETPPATSTSGPRPTLASSGVVSFSILHTNDFHIQLLEQKIGNAFAPGAARLAYFIKDYRKSIGPQNMLLFDAGDFIEGDFGYQKKYYTALYGGQAALNLFEDMGYQAAAVGNHELFYGEKVFLDILQKPLSFQFLAANINKVDESGSCSGELLTTPYQIHDIGEDNGPKVRVGVIGVTLFDMAGGAVYPEKFCVTDPAEAIANYYSEIKEQEHADVIVVISHNGYEVDLDIAQRLNDMGMPVDIIIGGHSHTFLDQPGLVGQTYVVQAGDLGKQVGIFNLTFDRAAHILDVKWSPQNITDQMPSDPETVEYLKTILP